MFMRDIDSDGWSAVFVILLGIVFVVFTVLVFACAYDTTRRKGIFNLGKRVKKRQRTDDFDRDAYGSPPGPDPSDKLREP